MARLSSIAKQARREKLVNRNWQKRHELKAIVRDMTMGDAERQDAQDKLNKMSRNSSPVRLRNRCQLTGRCRGVYRKFKLSRLCFREMANNGEIPGITKASW